jgi:formylglycine-generating enzyme required for sulfatase activity
MTSVLLLATPTLCEEFVQIPQGTFEMGFSGGYKDEQPEHKVRIEQSFQLGRTEVTNLEYSVALNWAQASDLAPDVVGNRVVSNGSLILDLGGSMCAIDWNGASFVVRDEHKSHPVCHVSWIGAAWYCNCMSLMNGYELYYGLGVGESVDSLAKYTGFRLPSESEWEFAASGFDGRRYPWGDQYPNSSFANFGQQEGGVCAVGSYPAGASAFGCLDMAGNVWEWCDSWYQEYGERDPQRIEPRKFRVIRGGGWYCNSSTLRTSYRSSYDARYGNLAIGFRVVWVR